MFKISPISSLENLSISIDAIEDDEIGDISDGIINLFKSNLNILAK